MESVEQILARLFPEKLEGPLSMADLGNLRANIARAMPSDTSVEITTFMNSASVTIRLPPKFNPINRTCIVAQGFK